MKHINCPVCETTVQWSESSKYRPFCSQRCRLIDLGDWASEKHTIAGEQLIDIDGQESPIDSE